jgi:hypothetical protein
MEAAVYRSADSEKSPARKASKAASDLSFPLVEEISGFSIPSQSLKERVKRFGGISLMRRFVVVLFVS